MIDPKISKRSFLRLTAQGAAILATAQIARPNSDPVSPKVTPWVQPLPIPPVAQPTTGPLSPAFDGTTNDGQACQHVSEYPPQKFYEINVGLGTHQFHPALPANQPCFSYSQPGLNKAGIGLPGPTFKAKYGQPIAVRFRNNFPATIRGNGINQTAIHLHNMHSASESDGYPLDYVTAGHYRDHHYSMVTAGQTLSGFRDSREVLNTLWYHDHRIDFTAANVYQGLFGFFLAFDDYDNDDEAFADPTGKALNLPSGKYDIPMAFSDPQFDSSGALYWDPMNTDGHVGDSFAVNGKAYPYLNVERRKYRFRILDLGPSRYYELFCNIATATDKPGKDVPFKVISVDGNLRGSPIDLSSLHMTPGNRFDVVMDFSQFATGTVLYIENRAEQMNGRGPTGHILSPGSGRMLKIIVGQDPATPDVSRVPEVLRPQHPALTQADLDAAVKRSFELSRNNGVWTINGEIMDPDKPAFTTTGGQPELWTLIGKGGWHHPMHTHFEEGIVVSRDGGPPLPEERDQRKDVIDVAPGEVVRVYYRGFRDFKGRYVMHCHNNVHEDHAMMFRFDVV